MPPPRRVTAERLVLALLAAAAACMAAGYFCDFIGLRVFVWPWVAAIVCGAWTLRSAALDDDAGVRGEWPAVVVVFGLVAAYLCWLAGPSLLPVTDGPDVVHHLQLMHFIQRTGRLPHDPSLGPYLLEMMNYTPGAHLLTALVARAVRADALRVVLPVAVFFVALKAAVVYLMALRLTPRGSAIAALSAPLLLFAPAAYAIGGLYQFFFFAQAVSEVFALGAVLGVLGWIRTGRRDYLVGSAFSGVGVVLSWPVYLAPVVAVVLVAVVRAPAAWRSRVQATAMAIGPACLVAAVHSILHPQGGGILSASGAVTAPSVSVFGWAFLALATAGVILAVIRREAVPIVVFFAAIVLTAGALAMLGLRAGARSYYLPFKLAYLAVAPAAILASWVLTLGSAAPRRFGRAFQIAAVIVAVLITLPRLPLVRPRSPITLSSHAAGEWVRANLNPRCVDYFSRHWLTGYWLHLDVLGNPRDSDRMRAETFEFRDIVARWIEGRGLPYAVVEDLAAIPRELRPELTVLASFPPVSVITHQPASCPW